MYSKKNDGQVGHRNVIIILLEMLQVEVCIQQIIYT